jgi:non-heme chloroperoxidase
VRSATTVVASAGRAIVQNRYAYFVAFFNDFYNVDVLGGSRISDRAWQASFNVAIGASPFATLPGLIDDVRLVRVVGGPRNVAWTHPDEVNAALLELLAD